MSGRSTEHATFVIERSFPAPRRRVFEAWASAGAKSRWWGPPSLEDLELDFRVGGLERFAAGVNGTRYTYVARYQDIVADERIVYTYEMYLNDERMSVSVATIEFSADGEGTRLTMTEQGVFLDGHDTVAQREHGTRELIERLAGVIGR
jgi:uncharacterized protein YndB with AHSA1/START domain